MAPEIVAHYPRGVSCLDVVCSGWFHSLGIHRQPSDAQRSAAADWLERFGLSRRAEHPLGSLSHGEQRLVLVARALVTDPWLLVLDEPCQGLDATHRAPLLAAVDEAAGQGRSRVVYVTHHLDELPRCITHVLELRAGRVGRAERRPAVGVAADGAPAP
jgi:molybdate transport system ATP-binding protein